jgi:hypothetical protein
MRHATGLSLPKSVYIDVISHLEFRRTNTGWKDMKERSENNNLLSMSYSGQGMEGCCSIILSLLQLMRFAH